MPWFRSASLKYRSTHIHVPSTETTKKIPKLSTWPRFTEDEIQAASAVLRSGQINYWTGGEGKAFEREFAEFIGVKHAVAAANGTVTLEMALQALGVGAGDEVVVSPRSFMASVSCVVTAGARPVFADVDRDSGNVTAESIARVLSPRTRAVLPVHLAGWPCEIDQIMALAAKNKLHVIEDCAQAHGAIYRDKPVGAWGHVGSFSFCQDKIITTGGEGGMLVTQDEDLWSRLWSLKDHGKSYDACFNRNWPAGFRWLHESFGSNYRLTEMQSAIGRLALRKLPGWLECRRRNAAQLSCCVGQFDCIRNPVPPDHVQHACYKLYCYVRPEALRSDWSRDRLLIEISARGVPCFSGSCSEIYLERAFDHNGLRPPTRLPVARELGETALMFLVHPTLTENEMDWVCDTVAHVLTEASA